ncbi:MAG TPA: histidine phosphatase family protein [Ktedonobacterales bacterium]
MTTDQLDAQPDENAEEGELFPGPTRHLYIVRHGQYTHGGPPDYDGPLTELGQRQATFTAARLAGLPVSVIHCSTLQRARESAAIIAERFPGVELRYSPLLCECIASVPPLIKDYLEERVPAQELAEGAIQARAAWETYFQPPAADATEDVSEIIVSSGNLIGYLVGQALGAPADAWMRSDIQHCGLTEITIRARRGPLLLRHNDIGHLPLEMRTFA